MQVEFPLALQVANCFFPVGLLVFKGFDHFVLELGQIWRPHPFVDYFIVEIRFLKVPTDFCILCYFRFLICYLLLLYASCFLPILLAIVDFLIIISLQKIIIERNPKHNFDSSTTLDLFDHSVNHDDIIFIFSFLVVFSESIPFFRFLFALVLIFAFATRVHIPLFLELLPVFSHRLSESADLAHILLALAHLNEGTLIQHLDLVSKVINTFQYSSNLIEFRL